MNRISVYILDYYNNCIVPRIAEKYNMPLLDAIHAFITSKTHNMLENSDMALWEPLFVF